MTDFSKYIIKDYRYWEVTIHENQSYLGRCVIWCKRPGALDLSEATPEEYRELLEIIQKLRSALIELFRPDWFNYAFLGNETRHLHGHFVPRYAAPRNFEGITFEDKLWGRNFQTNNDFKISEEILQKIKNLITKALS